MATASAPPRNDPKTGVKIYAQSRAVELQGRDKNFAYQYFSTDPKHPQFIGKYAVEHEIGNEAIGYAMVPAWEVCKKGEVEPGRARDDQGKAIDSTIRHGDLILAKLPIDAHAVYAVMAARRDELSQKRMRNGDAAQPRISVESGQGRFTSGLLQGAQVGANHIDALNARS